MGERSADEDLAVWEAATIGEWEASGVTVHTPPHAESQRRMRDKDFPIVGFRICSTNNNRYLLAGEAEANARFIAMAHQSLPYWIKRARDLEEQLG